MEGIVCAPRTDFFFFGGEDPAGDGEPLPLPVGLLEEPLATVVADDDGAFLRTALRCAFESVCVVELPEFELEPPLPLPEFVDFDDDEDVIGSIGGGGGADCEFRTCSALGIITGSSSDDVAGRGALEANE